MQALSGKAFPKLGIMGGGQLGRMMALAAIPMGIEVRFISPTPSGPIDGLGEHVIGDWNDPVHLSVFAAGLTAITVESEWAPAEHLLDMISPQTALWPHPDTLHLIRNKGRQKAALKTSGLPVPDFVCCPTLEAARKAASAFGYPVLLKRYLGSYDGYGNATVQNPAQLEQVWPKLSDENGLMVEAWVPFKRELSVMIARRPRGESVIYPVAYTEQRDHRCHAVVVPAAIPPATAALAKKISLRAVEAVSGVGVTAVELFEMEDGTILINELAPRPHNTGHYSIEGCFTSQFENHVRAVLDLPLGNPALRAPTAVMVNVLGTREGEPCTTGYQAALSSPETSVHIYGKHGVRPKRKMGHVTATGTDPDEVRSRAESAASLITL